MRLPRECYPLLEAIETHLGVLRPAQQRGLALWVYGTLLARVAARARCCGTLRPVSGGAPATRYARGLREWHGREDKTLPGRDEVDVGGLLRAVPGRGGLVARRGAGLGAGSDQAGERLVVLSVSVLYRGSAIPVAWHVTAPTAAAPGSPARPCWPAWRRRYRPGMEVLVLADRGLWSPRLWARICALRLASGAAPAPRCHLPSRGGQAGAAKGLVPGPGTHLDRDRHGLQQPRGAPCRDAGGRPGTMTREPWLVFNRLEPTPVGPARTGCPLDRAGLPRPQKLSAGTGSARAAPTPSGWRGTGWSWPSPRCGQWRSAPRTKMPSAGAASRPVSAVCCRHPLALSAHHQRLCAAAGRGCAGNCCASASRGDCSGYGRSRGPPPHQA